jgi:class 3 adenylate cyclase
MFCDLVGSAALSGKFDPEALWGVIAIYHRCCSEMVERNGGFVAKYIGDGQAVSSVVVRMTVATRGDRSSMDFSGVPTGILTPGLWGAKKPASPLALTDRGRIAPASRRSAGGAGVSTSAMGHCGDIQAKDPIDCGEPLFAAAIAGAAAPISAAAA